MRIKLLPSNVHASGQLQTLTTFLINDCLTIDAGSISVGLTPDEMSLIRHVVITHSHNDHIACLPVFVAEAFTELDSPVTIYGIEEVIHALKNFIFNDQIWPDFELIELTNGQGATIRYETLEPRTPVVIAGLRITPIPVNHTVPACGMIVEDEHATIIFSADTYTTDELWQRAAEQKNLKALFVDVSYPNELEELAAVSKHFTPQSLARDLQKLRREVEVYAVHIKPSNRQQVITQLQALNNPLIAAAEIGRVYEW
ncbi:MAG: 3',5'-cyclic-nucleotide phosphodiesterase [Acidobacteria bacterium]|nr:3',5'-cyclic-nucleotide phosphodiesterase [Acidobacteriota bacterium]